MYVRTLGQSHDNQTKRGWPCSVSMGLCREAREGPRYNLSSNLSWRAHILKIHQKASKKLNLKATELQFESPYTWRLIQILGALIE